MDLDTLLARLDALADLSPAVARNIRRWLEAERKRLEVSGPSKP